MFNRIAVLVISLMIALGLYLYRCRLRQVELERHGRHKLLESEVTHKTLELGTFAGYLLTVREGKKGRLARELHDPLGGLLTAAKLNLARMRAKLLGDVCMLERIQPINLHLNSGIALKRRIVEDPRRSALCPCCPGHGCRSARPVCERRPQHGKSCQDQHQCGAVAARYRAGYIYRIVQEVLTNIGKYAQPSEISVELGQTAATVLLNIQGNGCGFDLSTLKLGHHRLADMRFRVESFGRTINLISAPGQGTKIAMRLPAPGPAPSATPIPRLTPARAAIA